MKPAEIRYGDVLVLTEAEAAALSRQLPSGWTHPRLEALERGELLDHPFDAYELFDIKVRDAIDEIWEPQQGGTEGTPDYQLIQIALDRLVDAHPSMLDEILGPEEFPEERL